MPKLPRAEYLPNDRKWWGDVAKLGDDERVARKRVIDETWSYYKGDQPLPLKVRPGDPNYNVLLDLCGQAIDAMVSFLGVPTLDVVNGASAEPNAAGVVDNKKSREQIALDLIWEVNDLPVLMIDLLLSGFLAGHTFLKLLDDEQMPRVELIDPRYMTVYWVNTRAPLFYRMKWTDDGETTRTQDIVPNWLLEAPLVDQATAMGIVLGDISEWRSQWTIIEYEERRGQQVMEVGRDDWPFEFPPIIDWKNAPNSFEYYGRPDLTPIRLRTNDAANLSASNTQKILVQHAGPQTVVTGAELDDEVDSGPGTIIEIPDPNAKVYNLEMANDLGSSMGFLTMTRSSFFESVKVVDRASIKDKLGDLTNFAVRMLYGAQSDAGAQKQLFYGRGLVKVSRWLLALVGADVKVVDKWDVMLPQDRKETVESVATEADMGFVSQETMLEELGHDPQIEAQRKANEVDTAQDTMSNLLVRMGQRSGGALGAGGQRNG